jgi:hypothetical protein
MKNRARIGALVGVAIISGMLIGTGCSNTQNLPPASAMNQVKQTPDQQIAAIQASPNMPPAMKASLIAQVKNQNGLSGHPGGYGGPVN